MTTREQLKRKVIEAIHGLPYDEAIEKEELKCVCYDYCDPKYHHGFRHITIGRVMQALISGDSNSSPMSWNTYLFDIIQEKIVVKEWINKGEEPSLVDSNNINWKLTKENGEECTDYDQSDETIEALLKLFL